MRSIDIARLQAFGLDAKEAAAFIVLWSSERMDIMLDYTSSDLRENGYSAADAYDMVMHEIYSKALAYLRGGFTGHQAAIIENDERAHSNLYGQRRTSQQVRDMLLLPISADYKTNVLRSAANPAEARKLLTQFENLLNNFDRNRARLEELSTNAAFLASFMSIPDLGCTCR